MSFFDAMVTFAVTWWVILFMALPMGVHVPEKQQEPGHASSAPSKPQIGVKMLWTTVVAAFMTGVLYALFTVKGLTWQGILGVSGFHW